MSRISEEDFLTELEAGSLGRLGGDWRGRYEMSKSRLLHSLNFDGCNAWLEDINYLLSQTGSGIESWRLLYASCSHLLIAIDFILRELLTAAQEQRRQVIERGIRYGVSGQTFTENVGRMAAALVESVAAQPGLSQMLQHELQAQAAKVKADLLAEYFSKNAASSSLFELALFFETAAFSTNVPPPSQLPTSCQSIIGVIADFYDIDRKSVLI